MNRGGEVDMWWNEIDAGLFSGRLRSENALQSSTPQEERQYQSERSYFRLPSNNGANYSIDELGLCESLEELNIGNSEDSGLLQLNNLVTDPNANRYHSGSLNLALSAETETSRRETFRNEFGLRSSPRGFTETEQTLMRRGYRTSSTPAVTGFPDSNANAFSPGCGCSENQMYYARREMKEQGIDNFYHWQNVNGFSGFNGRKPPIMNRRNYSLLFGMNSSMERGVLSSGLENRSNENQASTSAGRSLTNIPHSPMPFRCEDSFIFEGRSLNYVVNNASNSFSGCEERNSSGILLQPNCSSLNEYKGFIYHIAKDQHGCRFLQRVFEEGSARDIKIVFEEIGIHVVELMMNPFGNYLVQKLLDVCSEEQRMQIVLIVTKKPGELVRICFNTHGTRSVQKLIQTLKNKQQIRVVMVALEPGFIDLIKDPNGNHVVQRCLDHLDSEDNKVIFLAAARFCVDIATHQHGCCVLQKCVDRASGVNREKMIIEIAAHALHLAQDAFGNYVVQFVIELEIPSINALIVSDFEGKFVQLSTQKFSSHVVEKCLRWIEHSRPMIIHELISVSHFDQLLQDQYANFVIQVALEVAKGALRHLLVDAVRPHANLRTSPYCKRIFSRNLLRK